MLPHLMSFETLAKWKRSLAPDVISLDIKSSRNFSVCLKSDPKKSWRKITNFLKPKSPRSYPTLKLGNKTAKTNPEKAQLFVESVERNFGIESHLFSKP